MTFEKNVRLSFKNVKQDIEKLRSVIVILRNELDELKNNPKLDHSVVLKSNKSKSKTKRTKKLKSKK